MTFRPLAQGYRADLVLLGQDLEVLKTWVGGEWGKGTSTSHLHASTSGGLPAPDHAGAGLRLDYFDVQPLYWLTLSRVTSSVGIRVTFSAGALP